MDNRGVTPFLIFHAEGKPVSFHMPGHKGSAFYKRNGHRKFLKHIMDCDITEIPGADNLFQAEGVLRETADRYAELYDVAKSYMLVNGTSGGLIASILASVPKGRKIIMARNCHKSIFNALTLGNITPVYVHPEVVPEYGISGAVSPYEIQRLLYENPDADAVILPSPNYYGICSDIKSIARIVHEHGKVLIVDQAHGAHLKFFGKYGLRKPVVGRPGGGKVAPVDVRKGAEAQAAYYEKHGSGQSLGEKGWNWSMPASAEECGADLVVNSIHKTLGSFTQSAVLNVTHGAVDDSNGRPRVDLTVLEDKLQAIQSTSPSYLLMASLDVNADIMETNGRKLFGEWKRNITWFYRKAVTIPELRIMTIRPEERSVIAEAAGEAMGKIRNLPFLRNLGAAREVPKHVSAGELDNTKLNIDMSAYKIDGNRLEEMLIEKGIYPELVTGNIVMCMTGIGNTRKDYKKLYKALAEIAFNNRAALVKLGQDPELPYTKRDELEYEGEAAVQSGVGDGSMASDPGSGAASGAAADGGFAYLWSKQRELYPIPEEGEAMKIDYCVDKICAASIIPYPPGIPLICPGEKIGYDEIQYIKELRSRGEKVIGINENNEIIVGK